MCPLAVRVVCFCACCRVLYIFYISTSLCARLFQSPARLGLRASVLVLFVVAVRRTQCWPAKHDIIVVLVVCLWFLFVSHCVGWRVALKSNERKAITATTATTTARSHYCRVAHLRSHVQFCCDHISCATCGVRLKGVCPPSRLCLCVPC